jgi:hypothetical protein
MLSSKKTTSSVMPPAGRFEIPELLVQIEVSQDGWLISEVYRRGHGCGRSITGPEIADVGVSLACFDKPCRTSC